MTQAPRGKTLADILTPDQLENLYFKPNGFGSAALGKMVRDVIAAYDRVNIAERALTSRYNSVDMRNVVNGTNDVPVFRASHMIEAALEDYFQANKDKLAEGLANMGIEAPLAVATLGSGAAELTKASILPQLQAAFGPIEARRSTPGRG